ncbi:MAG: PAS domain-containing protein [Prolixibacteraceae bacterium]
MVKLIQLFTNEDFFKKIRIACGKIDKSISLNQTAADLFFSAVNTIRRDLIFFVNSDLLEKYYHELHRLSISNFMVYVYTNESEIIDQPLVENLADHYLPVQFSNIELYNTLTLGKKTLCGHITTVFPRKLINTSVREIELLINEVSQRIFWKNTSGQYLGCNHKFAGDFELENIDDIIGKTDHALFDERYAIEMTAYDAQILKTGEPVKRFEKEIEFKSGKKKWLRFTKYPHMKEGVVIGLVGMYEVVRETQQGDQTLFSDQKLLEVLMEAIPDTIYFKDSNSKFIKINQAQARLIGISEPENAIGKTDFDFFDHQSAKVAFAMEQEIIFQGEPKNKLEYLGTNDGMFRWMNSLKVPIKDEKGNNIGTVGISRDVNELIKAREELAAERDLLQLLIDHIPSPIFFKDANSVFTRVNMAMAQLLNLSSVDEIVGKTDYDFYLKEEADVFFNDERKILESFVPLIDKIEKSSCDTEFEKWMSTTKIPLKNHKGELTGIVGISYDITKQMQVKNRLEFAKKKAEEASTAKSNFLSNMSHEIRTPMNGIIGMADVLSLTNLDEDQKKIVGIIMRSGNNLLHIINDILDLSKIEAGKLELEKTPINLKDLILEVKELLDFTAKDNNINLSVKIDTNLPELVMGDSLRFRQVLLNLVSNAIKFTKAGEVIIELIVIGHSDSKYCFMVKVTDTGIGMEYDQIENIFDSFTQADSSTTRKYGGTGLGLSISNKLIEMMGSKLLVKSVKGEGSTFYFEILFDKVSIGAPHYF